jgi:hypothetical protein
MIIFRTSADIDAGREVVVKLPPETPIGKADLVVMVVPQSTPPSGGGILRRHFGAFQSGNPRSADNELIDADLAREYGSSDR